MSVQAMDMIVAAILAALPPTATNIDPVAQAHAEREARLMADRGVVAHILGPAKGARFAGVGASRKPEPTTCLPWNFDNPARTVIADAIVKGKDGRNYRSRHWK